MDEISEGLHNRKICVSHQKSMGREIINRNREREGREKEGGRERREGERGVGRFRNNLIFQKKILK